MQRICFPVWVCLKLSPVTCPESYSFPTALSGKLSDTTGDTALRIKTVARGLQIEWKTHHTVDGRNPAPVDMEKLPLFTGFYTSQVVKDFFHQQCHRRRKESIYFPHCYDVHRGEKQSERRDLMVILPSRSTNPFEFRIIFRSSKAVLDA